MTGFRKSSGWEWGGYRSCINRERLRVANLANIFSEMAAQKFSIDDVRQFKNSCDFTANQDEYPMLAARVVPEPFSLVRFAREKDVRTLRFLSSMLTEGFASLGSSYSSCEPLSRAANRDCVEINLIVEASERRHERPNGKANLSSGTHLSRNRLCKCLPRT